MVMSFLIERKNYKLQEWLAALCITVGIVLFNLSRLSDSKHKEGQEDSIHGILLLLSSLLMDGFLGACQGLMKNIDPRGKQRPPTAMETMFYINLYALVWLLPMAWGEIQEGLDRLDEALEGMLLLNAAAASGQIFIFVTLTWFSSLLTTTITTTRKFFTILLSVLHFGHVFTLTQWTSIGLVFGGLYLGIASKATQTRGVGTKKKVE